MQQTPDANDFKMELALVNAECKRVSDLLAINERNLEITESELFKECDRNLSLQHEFLILTKEFKSILNNEEGISRIISKFFSSKKTKVSI